MAAIALSAAAPGAQNVLDTIEELLADDRFVSAWIDVALVDYVPHVVRIAQHLVQLAIRYRLLHRPPRGRTSCESEVCHGGLKKVNRVVTRRVQFPRLEYKRCPFWVDSDRVDHPTLMLHAGIQIPKPSSANRSPVDRLVLQLRLNVQAAQRVLQPVHDVGETLHRDGVRPLTEVFLHRDQPHPQLFELAAYDRSIEVITEGT
nr:MULTISPECIES: hypothetical protein [unclassified Rhodococcus (in: high G+C Gram-positive bacteria)]